MKIIALFSPEKMKFPIHVFFINLFFNPPIVMCYDSAVFEGTQGKHVFLSFSSRVSGLLVVVDWGVFSGGFRV